MTFPVLAETLGYLSSGKVNIIYFLVYRFYKIIKELYQQANLSISLSILTSSITVYLYLKVIKINNIYCYYDVN